ncbi:MAG: alpha/beta hydrolase [Candidatus Saccharibacteria bacterium]
MRSIIFSHGFGVRKDSKGLFTDLKAGLAPDYAGHMLDLNILEADQVIIVPPVSEQAKILETRIREEGEEVDIIAHSQGTLVAAALPAGLPIRRIILLAPPVKLASKLMSDTYTDHPMTQTMQSGHLQFVRKNGDRMWMSPEYMKQMRAVDPVEWINKLALHYPVTLIRATEDEVLDTIDDSGFKNITVINVSGDHDFDPPDRDTLIETIKSVLD